MKDIDFDELDKAVSNLLGGTKVPNSTPATQPPTENTENITVRKNEQPVQATSSEPAKTPDAAKTAPTPTAKRAGRFMDVVHPSHEARPARPAAARAVKREGVDLTPPDKDLVPTPPSPSLTPEPAPSAPAPATADIPDPLEFSNKSTVQDDTSQEETSDDLRMPDPLDMHTTTPAPAEQTQEEDPTPDTPSELDEALVAELEKPLQDEPTSTMESPFLAGAEVEKRPLGSAPQAESDEAETTLDDLKEDKLSSDDEQIAPDPEELPDELHDDLVDIESRELSPEATTASPAKKTSSNDDTEAPDNDVTAPSAPVRQPQPDRTPPSTAIAGGSISQQYRVKEQQPGKESASIYDTDHYHQPLKHPEKRSSGWLHALLIFVLVVFGGVGGAAVYFFVLN